MGSVKGKQSFLKMTHEEFIQKTDKNNTKLNVIGTYKCNREKVDVECKQCWYQWKVVPSNILRNAGCPVCNGNKKMTHETTSGIVSCCMGKYKTSGRHSQTSEILRWMYYKDYIKKFDESTLLSFDRFGA